MKNKKGFMKVNNKNCLVYTVIDAKFYLKRKYLVYFKKENENEFIQCLTEKDIDEYSKESGYFFSFESEFIKNTNNIFNSPIDYYLDEPYFNINDKKYFLSDVEGAKHTLSKWKFVVYFKKENEDEFIQCLTEKDIDKYSKESGYFFSPESEYQRLTEEIFSLPFDEDEPDFDF